MKIYHYTNIHALSLILKSKSIKMNSLANVNDLEEAMTVKYGSLANYIFVSCWTKYSEESIPLWNMYAGLDGVRITIDFEETTRAFFFDKQFPVFDPDENGNYAQSLKFKFFNIEYTDDEKMLYPKIDDDLTLLNEYLARYKRKLWSFEDEFRIAYIWGLSPKKNKSIPQSQTPNLFKHFRPIGESKSISIPFREQEFQNMEILLGPKNLEANRIIAKLLTERFNPTAKIIESKLKIQKLFLNSTLQNYFHQPLSLKMPQLPVVSRKDFLPSTSGFPEQEKFSEFIIFVPSFFRYV